MDYISSRPSHVRQLKRSKPSLNLNIVMGRLSCMLAVLRDPFSPSGRPAGDSDHAGQTGVHLPGIRLRRGPVLHPGGPLEDLRLPDGRLQLCPPPHHHRRPGGVHLRDVGSVREEGAGGEMEVTDLSSPPPQLLSFIFEPFWLTLPATLLIFSLQWKI